MEENGVVYAITKELNLWFHKFFEFAVGIYMQRSRTSKQTKCRYQSYKPETVVAMQVRYEYVIYEREVYVLSAQLSLCSFTAVNHELLVPNAYDL